jgi:hypothetical protein
MLSAIPYLGIDFVSFIWGKLNTIVMGGDPRGAAPQLVADPHFMWAPLTTKILFINETNATPFGSPGVPDKEDCAGSAPVEPPLGPLNFTKRRKSRKVTPLGPLPTVNDSFMAMLIGLIDGDGYIGISPQSKYIKISLVIALGIRGADLIKEIRSVLGFGKIYYYKSKTESYGDRIIITFSKSELTDIIFPLMLDRGIYFLTYQRRMQYNIAKSIIDHDILLHSEIPEIQTIGLPELFPQVCQLSKVSWIKNWLVGFTMAEGSFGIKNNGDAFYSIRQTGENNYMLRQAIYYILTARLKEITVDSDNSYKLTVQSKLHIQTVINLFSFSELYPLIGYKGEQYKHWLLKLKKY